MSLDPWDPYDDAVRVPEVRRRWIVLAVVIVLALATLRLLYQPLTLDSYRVLDQQVLVVTGHGYHGAWTRLSEVDETESTVMVRVDAFTLVPGPSTGLGSPLDVVVRLAAPLGGRRVIDGSTGQEIPAAPDP